MFFIFIFIFKIIFDRSVPETFTRDLLRWVDGSMGGPRGARPPPCLAAGSDVECAHHVHLLQKDASASLPFSSLPFSGRFPQKHQIPLAFCTFGGSAPLRAQPLPAQHAGPFLHTCARRSGVNDGGGPSTHRRNFEIVF